MLDIGYFRFAPTYVKATSDAVVHPKAYAFFRLYEPSAFPSLRDRTEEATIAVQALADGAAVIGADLTGHEVNKFAGETIFAGANASATYRLLLA